MSTTWPQVTYSQWQQTSTALHLLMQMAGKYRLARTPWMNHSWHATLYPTARGFTTGPSPDNGHVVELSFDLLDHRLIGQSSNGLSGVLHLGETSVADFHARLLDLLHNIGATAEFSGTPNEVADPVPFARDFGRRPYDRDAVTRFFMATMNVARVFAVFRTGFLGKVSPVHLFWGSFDLAVTRFSGNRAPLHPGGVPGLPDEVTREAYSHEVSSAGFWPGGGPVSDAAFYSYAYPPPPGFSEAAILPAAAYFHQGAGEFILPYEEVRRAPDPDAMLMAFLTSTYRAAAELGRWPVADVECELGVPRRPRQPL